MLNKYKFIYNDGVTTTEGNCDTEEMEQYKDLSVQNFQASVRAMTGGSSSSTDAVAIDIEHPTYHSLKLTVGYLKSAKTALDKDGGVFVLMESSPIMGGLSSQIMQ